MTIPGAGGQTPPRPDQQTQAAQPVPVSPGSSQSVRALQVIISSGRQGTGLFIYNGTAGPGNPPVLSAVAPGVTQDPYGNAVSAVLNVGQIGHAHIGFDLNGIEYVSDSTGTTRINIDPGQRVIEFYDSSGAGANQALITIAPQAGTQTFTAFPFPAGVTLWTAGTGYPQANMNTGTLSFQATSTQFAPGQVGTFATAGEIGFTSGLITNTDSAANIVVDSSQASGISTPFISLQAGEVSLNTTASQNVPYHLANPGHQSAAPATYSQSYENATTNRLNDVMDVLAAVGIWPF